ncbi:adenylate/guanylate cyclase domain-containing protein, partial [Mesorhizobium sp. M1A.T.Ca.IN.004.03.1.1]
MWQPRWSSPSICPISDHNLRRSFGGSEINNHIQWLIEHGITAEHIG